MPTQQHGERVDHLVNVVLIVLRSCIYISHCNDFRTMPSMLTSTQIARRRLALLLAISLGCIVLISFTALISLLAVSGGLPDTEFLHKLDGEQTGVRADTRFHQISTRPSIDLHSLRSFIWDTFMPLMLPPGRSKSLGLWEVADR